MFIGNVTTNSTYFTAEPTFSSDATMASYNLRVNNFNELEEGETYTVEVRVVRFIIDEKGVTVE